MLDLLKTEKDLLSPHIKEGSVCVDFTMGNGYDTLYLAKSVGETGFVYAFDIQMQALDNTEKLLLEKNIKNVKLIHDSHSNLKKYVKEKFDAGMFNLGFLPGGNKSITTLHETTMEAILSGIEMLNPGGAILIAVYPGHEEGTIEGNLIREILSYADRKVFCCSEFHLVNSPTSPFFYLIEKSDKKERQKIAVSACLLGDRVRYDGNSKPMDKKIIWKLRIKYDIVKICPESSGGLKIPREPSERIGEKIISRANVDVTENFILGAEKTLETIKRNGIEIALMKKRSPSCSNNGIYDGTFSGNIKDGLGVSAELLINNGIKVYNEEEIENII